MAEWAWPAWSLTGRTRTCRLALLTGTAGSPPRRRPFVFYPQSICGKTVLTHVVYKSSFFALNPASPAANQGPLHEAGRAQTPQPRGLPCAALAPRHSTGPSAASTPVTQPGVPVSPLRRVTARGHPRLGSRLPGSHLYRFTKCFPMDRAPECRSRMDAWKRCGEARVRPAWDTEPGARGEPRLLDTHTRVRRRCLAGLVRERRSDLIRPSSSCSVLRPFTEGVLHMSPQTPAAEPPNAPSPASAVRTRTTSCSCFQQTAW